MKSIYFVILSISLFLALSCQKQREEKEHGHTNALKTEESAIDTVKKSIPKEAHAQIGKAHVLIKYHAPAVRGRTIWGGLVSYGEVWVTGAHSATSLEIDKDFIVNGKEIAAGKYAIFTIPGRDKWTIILNKNWDQHLADEYNQMEDLIRFETIPEQNENVQERLKYSILPNGQAKGTVSISWEKMKLTFPIQIK